MRAGVIFIANLNIPKLRTKIHFQLFDNALKNINRKTAGPSVIYCANVILKIDLRVYLEGQK